MEPRGPSAEDEFGRVRHPLVPTGLWVRNSSWHWGTSKPPQPGGADKGRGRRLHFPEQPYATRASLDNVQCIAVGSNNWMCQKKKGFCSICGSWASGCEHSLPMPAGTPQAFLSHKPMFSFNGTYRLFSTCLTPRSRGPCWRVPRGLAAVSPTHISAPGERRADSLRVPRAAASSRGASSEESRLCYPNQTGKGRRGKQRERRAEASVPV